MSELTFAAAFLAGLLGSAHCLTMCGGIAAALGTAVSGGGRRAWRPLLYNVGRLASYGVAGAITGALGAAFGGVFALSRWSDLLRLATAVVVIVIGLQICFAASAPARWLRAPERWGALAWRRFVPIAGRLLPASSAVRPLALGMLWGWLPCGLVYSVLLAAGVSGGAARGSIVMIAFGVGTLPAMAGLSYLGGHLPRRDSTLTRLVGAALVACGLWTAIVPLAALRGAQPHTHHEMSVRR